MNNTDDINLELLDEKELTELLAIFEGMNDTLNDDEGGKTNE